MYGYEPPRELKPDWVEAVARCPAVDGVGSKTSTAHLTRWKAVFAGIEDWHRTGDDQGAKVRDRTTVVDITDIT